MVLELEPSTYVSLATMHTTWIRWTLIAVLALPAAMAAMHVIRNQKEASPALMAKVESKAAKQPANAIAKASQMDKITDALRGEQ